MSSNAARDTQPFLDQERLEGLRPNGRGRLRLGMVVRLAVGVGVLTAHGRSLLSPRADRPRALSAAPQN